MLGATHACANPLSARYGTAHGAAIAMLLPTVVRWNESVAAERYAELMKLTTFYDGAVGDPTAQLADRLKTLALAGGLDCSLSDAGVPRNDLPFLAQEAAKQWTGGFNPRAFDESGALEVYQWAF
jgi:alcohol dehydrogenase